MTVRLASRALAQRAPVWAALSNLFLDTDVFLLHGYIAHQLRRTPYSESELLQILRTEAGPAFFLNLFSIAGEWVGYDEAEASRIVLRYLALPAPQRWLARGVSIGIVNRVVADHWCAITLRRANFDETP